MHKLLERQLRHAFGSVDAAPAGLQEFLQAVDAAYHESDADRHLLERSLELTSQELLQRYAALRQQQRDQQVIFDSVPALIFYKDADNKILRANAALARFLGRTVAEVEGRHVGELYPPGGAATSLMQAQEVLRTGQPLLGIVEALRTPAGAQRWVRTDRVPYRDETGKVAGVIVIAVDITDLKAAEERLGEANQELQRLVQVRTQFLNNTAHELRTPLTPVLLQSHILRHALGPQMAAGDRKGFEILERNLRRLDYLVNDLLDAARLQSGRLPLRLAQTDLNAVVLDSVESYREVATRAGVELVGETAAPLWVSGDAARLTQVLFNLLSNAVRFSRPGGRVLVRCRADGPDAVVEVIDRGIGIKPDALARLFQPFSQVHDLEANAQGGTGLGLYVCKGIVEAHGGTIGARSDGLGQGATFTVRLPAPPAGASPGVQP